MSASSTQRKLAEDVLEHGILDLPCPDCRRGVELVYLDRHGTVVSREHGQPGHAHDDAHWYCTDARAQGVIDILGRAVLDLAERADNLWLSLNIRQTERDALRAEVEALRLKLDRQIVSSEREHLEALSASAEVDALKRERVDLRKAVDAMLPFFLPEVRRGPAHDDWLRAAARCASTLADDDTNKRELIRLMAIGGMYYVAAPPSARGKR